MWLQLTGPVNRADAVHRSNMKDALMVLQGLMLGVIVLLLLRRNRKMVRRRKKMSEGRELTLAHCPLCKVEYLGLVIQTAVENVRAVAILICHSLFILFLWLVERRRAHLRGAGNRTHLWGELGHNIRDTRYKVCVLCVCSCAGPDHRCVRRRRLVRGTGGVRHSRRLRRGPVGVTSRWLLYVCCPPCCLE